MSRIGKAISDAISGYLAADSIIRKIAADNAALADADGVWLSARAAAMLLASRPYVSPTTLATHRVGSSHPTAKVSPIRANKAADGQYVYCASDLIVFRAAALAAWDSDWAAVSPAAAEKARSAAVAALRAAKVPEAQIAAALAAAGITTGGHNEIHVIDGAVDNVDTKAKA